MYELAGYRALQGLGAGGLMALAITILGDLVAPRERARYQGVLPRRLRHLERARPGGRRLLRRRRDDPRHRRLALGVPRSTCRSASSRSSSSRACCTCRRSSRSSTASTGRARSLLVVTLVPLLLVAEQGREWGWDSPDAIACYVDRRARPGRVHLRRAVRQGATRSCRCTCSATAPSRSVRAPTSSSASACSAAWPRCRSTCRSCKGQTPTAAGLTLIPFTLGIMAGSIIAGQTTSRTGRYKALPGLRHGPHGQRLR